jgi:hypothetical protein
MGDAVHTLLALYIGIVEVAYNTIMLSQQLSQCAIPGSDHTNSVAIVRAGNSLAIN